MQYAYFDSTTPSPSPVLGWYDTDALDYPNLPNEADLLVTTSDQWTARMTGRWAVSDGALVAYTLPTSPVTVDQMLAEKIAAGITITSTSTPALNAIYALGNVSTGQIFQIATWANGFGTFPSGQAEQPYPDATGAMHTFTVPQFIEFAKAVAPLVSNLTTQAGIMKADGTPVWPAQTATIP